MLSVNHDAAADSPAASAVHRVADRRHDERVDWLRLVALTLMHVGCFGVLLVGFSWTAFAAAAFLYIVRAFGLTAFYHRYFAHRAFRTSRIVQFLGGLLGCLALQKGPLWWAAHHRDHHRYSDHHGDVHSPHVHGVLWAHMGWFLTPRNNELRSHLIRDWMKFPELVWLDRASPIVAILFAATVFATGELCRVIIPNTETNGWQFLVWCFFISTVALYHATYSVNSLAHIYGRRRFDTPDHSRNNAFVALMTLGEGWHNNHHYYPSAARQGFFPSEVDPTYYVLAALARLQIVWNLRPVPQHVLAAGIQKKSSSTSNGRDSEGINACKV